VADKGYTSQQGRRSCRQYGISATIPTRRHQRPNLRFNCAVHRERNRVERLVNRFKQFRRVATRYEKRGVNYLAMVTLAAITVWLWARSATTLTWLWLQTLPLSHSAACRCIQSGQSVRQRHGCRQDRMRPVLNGPSGTEVTAHVLSCRVRQPAARNFGAGIP
jgi:Transposase DDE domain